MTNFLIDIKADLSLRSVSITTSACINSHFVALLTSLHLPQSKSISLHIIHSWLQLDLEWYAFVFPIHISIHRGRYHTSRNSIYMNDMKCQYFNQNELKKKTLIRVSRSELYKYIKVQKHIKEITFFHTFLEVYINSYQNWIPLKS